MVKLLINQHINYSRVIVKVSICLANCVCAERWTHQAGASKTQERECSLNPAFIVVFQVWLV